MIGILSKGYLPAYLSPPEMCNIISNELQMVQEKTQICPHSKASNRVIGLENGEPLEYKDGEELKVKS